jgi:hypothetical protein
MLQGENDEATLEELRNIIFDHQWRYPEAIRPVIYGC